MDPPTPPTPEAAAELKRRLPELHAAAAAAIRAADFLLVSTGAGWSVPSGLLAYNDVAAHSAYRARGITYADLCAPSLLHGRGCRGRDVDQGDRVSNTGASSGANVVAAPAAKRQRRGLVVDDDDGNDDDGGGNDDDDDDDDDNPSSLSLDQLSSDSRRALFYGFWGGCHDTYRATLPHSGYKAVLRWRERVGPSRFFCLTTNVDSHWLAAGLPRESLEEFNGSALWWRCADPRCVRHLAADRDPHCPGGFWQAPPSTRFEVDPETRMAHAGRRPAAAGCARRRRPGTPTSAELGGKEADVGVKGEDERVAVVRVGSAQPFDKAAFEDNQPRCVRCGGFARPSVKMFDDSDTFVQLPAQLTGSHSAWTARMEAEAGRMIAAAAAVVDRHQRRLPRFVVFECGAGANVRTLRHISMRATRDLAGEAGAHCTLIRVNPEYPENEHELYEGVEFIPLMEGAVEAIDGIEQEDGSCRASAAGATGALDKNVVGAGAGGAGGAGGRVGKGRQA